MRTGSQPCSETPAHLPRSGHRFIGHVCQQGHLHCLRCAHLLRAGKLCARPLPMHRPAEWGNPWTTLLKAVGMSIALKREMGWSRNVGAGFIADDIQAAVHVRPHGVRMTLFSGWTKVLDLMDLNLRETEELQTWARAQVLTEA